MDNSLPQQILSAIITQQKSLRITEADLVAGIMDTTTWWRIRKHKADLSLPDALQLLSRVGLYFKVYQPEVTHVMSAPTT